MTGAEIEKVVRPRREHHWVMCIERNGRLGLKILWPLCGRATDADQRVAVSQRRRAIAYRPMSYTLGVARAHNQQEAARCKRKQSDGHLSQNASHEVVSFCR